MKITADTPSALTPLTGKPFFEKECTSLSVSECLW